MVEGCLLSRHGPAEVGGGPASRGPSMEKTTFQPGSAVGRVHGSLPCPRSRYINGSQLGLARQWPCVNRRLP